MLPGMERDLRMCTQTGLLFIAIAFALCLSTSEAFRVCLVSKGASGRLKMLGERLLRSITTATVVTIRQKRCARVVRG